jgi:hypothetical protein
MNYFNIIYRPRLPEYLLDFGYVVLGTVKDHIVKASNTGWEPVSFQVEHDNVHLDGFHVELNKVKNLPGRNKRVNIIIFHKSFIYSKIVYLTSCSLKKDKNVSHDN